MTKLCRSQSLQFVVAWYLNLVLTLQCYLHVSGVFEKSSQAVESWKQFSKYFPQESAPILKNCLPYTPWIIFYSIPPSTNLKCYACTNTGGRSSYLLGVLKKGNSEARYSAFRNAHLQPKPRAERPHHYSSVSQRLVLRNLCVAEHTQ